MFARRPNKSLQPRSAFRSADREYYFCRGTGQSGGLRCQKCDGEGGMIPRQMWPDHALQRLTTSKCGAFSTALAAARFPTCR